MTTRTTASRLRPQMRDQGYSIRSNDLTTTHIDSSSTFDPASSNWTLGMWIHLNEWPRLNSPSNDNNFYAQQNGTGQGRSWFFVSRTSNQLATFFNGVGTTWDVFPEPGWHHYTITCDVATRVLDLYVDGAFKATVTVPGIESATGNHVLMNNEINTGGIIGNLGETVLIRQKLSAASVEKLYAGANEANANIEYVYLVNEGSGTTLRDNSGNGKNATITGGAWSTQSPTKPSRLNISVPRANRV